ncbi:hypothetical protein GCM10009741_39570 [Kribbella lupini]|uniref:Secreted protein n=1 Tax=Kribbella lupini TaxID=291602 RepID=A0ABN2B515_9ACTN
MSVGWQAVVQAASAIALTVLTFYVSVRNFTLVHVRAPTKSQAMTPLGTTTARLQATVAVPRDADVPWPAGAYRGSDERRWRRAGGRTEVSRDPSAASDVLLSVTGSLLCGLARAIRAFLILHLAAACY